MGCSTSVVLAGRYFIASHPTRKLATRWKRGNTIILKKIIFEYFLSFLSISLRFFLVEPAILLMLPNVCGKKKNEEHEKEDVEDRP